MATMTIENDARELMVALAKGYHNSAEQYLTDDFTVSGPTPEPIDKAQFLGLHSLLAQAFPDFSFNASEVKDQGDTVEVTIQISGTQTGVLDLSPTGLPIPVIQPTGRKVMLPEEHPVMSVRDGKFSALNLPQVPGGGVMGILQQLGLEMPAHP
jgi:hypothetical protein